MTDTTMPSYGTRLRRLLTASLLCSLLLAVAACGQRGPLYLPDDKPASGDAQQEAENKDEKDDKETPGS